MCKYAYTSFVHVSIHLCVYMYLPNENFHLFFLTFFLMKQLFLSSFLRCNAYMLKNLKHMHVLVDILFSHAYYLVSFFDIY